MNLKYIYIAMSASLLATSLSAQVYKTNTWSVGAGARVGFGSMMQDSEVKSDRTNGFDGAVDGVFNYYFGQKNVSLPNFGIRTGLALGYKQNSLSMPLDMSYTVSDAQGNDILYHITADKVKETDKQFSVEVPVMFAVLYRQNIFANVGLKFAVPLMSRYKQTLSNPEVETTYTEYGVTLHGERVTGLISTSDESTKAKLEATAFNMCLSFEGGYIFNILKTQLGVGVYVDYGIVDNFKGSGKKFADADPTAIDGDTNTPAPIVVRSLTDSYVSKVGVFDAGIRAVYTIKHSNNGRRNKMGGGGSYRGWK